MGGLLSIGSLLIFLVVFGIIIFIGAPNRRR